MIVYSIRDGSVYLKWFSNNCAWFTPIRHDALDFEQLEEAKIVARALSPLASDGLQVYPETKYSS